MSSTGREAFERLQQIARIICADYGINFAGHLIDDPPPSEGSIAWGLLEAYKFGGNSRLDAAIAKLREMAQAEEIDPHWVGIGASALREAVAELERMKQ